MNDASQSSENAPLLRLKLEGLPSTPNARQHFMARANHVKAWRTKVFTACWHKRPSEPLNQARIVFTRCSSVEPDYDNLVASFKACMDGLRQAGWIVDDKRRNVGAPEYRWERAPKGSGYVVIEVYQTTQTGEQK